MARGAGSLARRLTADPLIHFLLIGLAVFVAADRSGADRSAQSPAETITVERGDLLEYYQYQNRSFDKGADAALAGLSEAERAALIAGYVREEALYREALRLGFDRSDYVIRRRLVQAMEYAAGAWAAPPEPPSEAELRAYFEANAQAYATPALISFTHVFFADRAGADAAQARAEAALRVLTGPGAPAPSQAPPLGDAFAYNTAYGAASEARIADHFGAGFAAAVFGAGEPGRWIGQLRYDYRVHLVRIANRAAAQRPDFTAARGQVEADWRRAAADEARAAALAEAISRYRVVDVSDAAR